MPPATSSPLQRVNLPHGSDGCTLSVPRQYGAGSVLCLFLRDDKAVNKVQMCHLDFKHFEYWNFILLCYISLINYDNKMQKCYMSTQKKNGNNFGNSKN